MINFVSNLILPLLVLFVILYGLYKKVDIYNEFVEGSKESFELIYSMFPCFLAMIFGVNIFLKSGFLNYFSIFLSPLLSFFHLPFDLLPMILMRPISGSTSLVILGHIFATYGPDSLTGILASVMQGSTDTTFYVLTLYFGSVGIKKIRYSLFVGLFADLCAIIISILIVNCFF